MSDLTRDELTIIRSYLPFLDMEPGEERLKAVSDFMRDAMRLHMFGAQEFLHTIEATDDSGQEVTVQWEPGDDSVGISSGWSISGVVREC